MSKHPQPSPPASGLLVIAAGLPRCATTSLQSALQSPTLALGPCLHMRQLGSKPERIKLVTAAMAEPDRLRRHALLRDLCAGYRSTTDMPMNLFIADLMDMYPDARVILNLRPGPTPAAQAASWAKSINGSLRFFAGSWYLALCFWIRFCRYHCAWHRRIYETFALERYGGGLVVAGEGQGADWMTEEFYGRYNEWVRAEARKRGREVLEYQPGMGWRPLCEFLGKEDCIPAVEGTAFPHLNDAKQMRKIKAILIGMGLIRWFGVAAVVGCSWAYAPWMLRRIQSLIERLPALRA